MQLDSLALNLKRIQVLVCSGSDALTAQHLVRESQFFIEWMVSQYCSVKREMLGFDPWPPLLPLIGRFAVGASRSRREQDARTIRTKQAKPNSIGWYPILTWRLIWL